MSTQTTVNGYIGERSTKLSSLYADNYVVADLVDTTSLPDNGGSITMNTTSGRFTTNAGIGPGSEASEVVTVTNSTVGVGSKIMLSIHNVITAADNGSVLVYVENVVQGAFDIRFANTSNLGWSGDIQFIVSFLIFNPSA